jgi:hypothetical protein
MIPKLKEGWACHLLTLKSHETFSAPLVEGISVGGTSEINFIQRELGSVL